MNEMNKFIYKILFFLLITFSVNAENKILSIGSVNAKVTVKVFSSLTCPHCANFHENIFDELKKDYINENLVRFEHHSFPLDLAALNAEIIVRCHSSNESKFQLLGEIYKKQNKWAVGSDINLINESIKKIEAQKKYKIQSTPTIFINDKKYEGDHKYKTFKKAVVKILKKYEI